jgi:hypothetical protein
MVERFNRASLLQGSVAPVAGGNVSVPTDDPQNRVLAQGFGSLASRLDTFKATAFKVAGARAETMGTLYGASTAPTQDQLLKAQQTGEVIDLPGDASSLNIFNQAAYAGSLSVVEDRVEIAGRRSLTQAMAEAAADPDMDPQTFTAKLDTVVREYSAQMATVSPTSAAKINSSLGLVANSQVVSFSREFMTKAIKQQTNVAKESANVIVDDAPAVITGHQSAGDVTLLESLQTQRSRVRSILEKATGVTEDYILRAEKRFDTKIRKAQEGVVLNWARSTEAFTKNPTAAARELLKHNSKKQSTLPQHIKDVWDVTDVETRNTVFKSISSLAGELNKLDQIDTARSKQNRDQAILEQTSAFSKARTTGRTWADKKTGMEAAILTLNALGYDTTDMQEIVDRGPITRMESNIQDKTRLAKAVSMGALTYRAINDAQLNEDDTAAFVMKLENQRDSNVKEALTTVKNDPLFADVDFSGNPDSDGTKTKKLRRRYNQVQDIVEKSKLQFERKLQDKIRRGAEITSDDYFDANVVAEEAVRTIRGEILNKELGEQQKKVENAYKILDKANAGGANFPRTPQGLRMLLESTVPGLFGYGRNPRYPRNPQGQRFNDGLKISNALKTIRHIDDIQSKLSDLEGD